MSKILIVEDEVAIADLEKDYLELSGFEVEIENDGTSGLARALAEEFDLFILDLMLPGIDGFEICKEIREKKNTPIYCAWLINPVHQFDFGANVARFNCYFCIAVLFLQI